MQKNIHFFNHPNIIYQYLIHIYKYPQFLTPFKCSFSCFSHQQWLQSQPSPECKIQIYMNSNNTYFDHLATEFCVIMGLPIGHNQIILGYLKQLWLEWTSYGLYTYITNTSLQSFLNFSPPFNYVNKIWHWPNQSLLTLGTLTWFLLNDYQCPNVPFINKSNSNRITS